MGFLALKIYEDNIVEVSRYAYSSYSLSRYDEIEAEIKAFRRGK